MATPAADEPVATLAVLHVSARDRHPNSVVDRHRPPLHFQPKMDEISTTTENSDQNSFYFLTDSRHERGSQSSANEPQRQRGPEFQCRLHFHRPR